MHGLQGHPSDSRQRVLFLNQKAIAPEPGARRTGHLKVELDMNISISTLDGIRLVRISGIVDKRGAGRLYDTLMAGINEGRAAIIVDISEVPRITRAGAHGLIVAARLLQASTRMIRISGARDEVETFLQGLGIDNLLKRDPSVTASLAVLASHLPRPEEDISGFAAPHTARQAWLRAAG